MEKSGLIRVVFVDDESEVLRNLQRLIFATQTKLNASFLTSATEALVILEKEHVDVVVSDLRMPDVSGADFLTEIKQRWPEIVRIALADEKDASTVVASAPVAHHFLTKPLDPTKLTRLIERAAVLKKQISAEQLKEKFGKLEVLPSPPQHIIELNNILNSPNPSMDQIASLVSEDASLSAQVLHLVNSAFFGLVSEINDLRHATSYLGLNAVRDLAIVVEMTNSFNSSNPDIAQSIDAINSHSRLVAEIARDLLTVPTDKQKAFTAGMLHDVGLMALASVDPDKFKKVNALTNPGHCLQSTNDDLSEAEETLVGASHASLGGYLLSMWGLSHPIVEAVALHHDMAAFSEDEFGLDQALHFADALSRQQTASNSAVCQFTTEVSVEKLGIRRRLEAIAAASREGDATPSPA